MIAQAPKVAVTLADAFIESVHVGLLPNDAQAPPQPTKRLIVEVGVLQPLSLHAIWGPGTAVSTTVVPEG